MLSVVGDGYTDSELGTQILNEEVGNGFLDRLQRRRRKNLSETGAGLPKFLQDGASVKNGCHAEIIDYDPAEDAIVFAYDPEQTPEPDMELRNGNSSDDKLLFMNGHLVVHFANSRLLTISDINVIETKIPRDPA